MIKFLKKSIKFVGIFIFLIIIIRADKTQLKAVLSEVDILKLFLIFMLSLPITTIVSYRWHLLLKQFSIDRPFWENIKLYFAGILIGNMTPGRLGEFYRVIRLGKQGYSKINATFSIFIARIFDVAFVFIFSIIAGFYLLRHSSVSGAFFKSGMWIGCVVMVTIFVLLFVFKEFTANFIHGFIKKIFKMDISAEELRKTLSAMTFLSFIQTAFMTFIFWTGYFYVMFLMANMVGIQLPFPVFFLIMSLVSLAAAFPMTVMGLGTREFALMNSMLLLGIPNERSLALSFLIYIYFAYTTLLFSLLWYLEHK